MHVYVEKRRLDCEENHPTFNLTSLTLLSLFLLTHSTPLQQYFTLQTCFHPSLLYLLFPLMEQCFPRQRRGWLPHLCQILTQLLPSQCILTRPGPSPAFLVLLPYTVFFTALIMMGHDDITRHNFTLVMHLFISYAYVTIINSFLRVEFRSNSVLHLWNSIWL